MNQLHYFTISDKEFAKKSRHEKILKIKKISDLRKMAIKQGFSVEKGLTKSQLIYMMMEKKFGVFEMKVYSNVRDERSSPRRP